MSEPSKRTRMRAIYITDAERDLVISALACLHQQISSATGAVGGDNYACVKFAKSHTSKRISAVRILFEDKMQEAQS